MSQRGMVEIQVLVDRALLDHEETEKVLISDLEEVGLKIDRVLPRLGVILGVLPADQFRRVNQVAGVRGVERNRPVRTAV